MKALLQFLETLFFKPTLAMSGFAQNDRSVVFPIFSILVGLIAQVKAQIAQSFFSRLKRSCFSAIFLLVFLLSVSSSWGQSIFTNPITGTNPNTSNPYTVGQTVASGITVSGIGRGSGIGSRDRDNSYYANNWTNSTSIDLTDYFEWTLTPGSCNTISFTQLDLEIFKNTNGPRNLVLRSSIDDYASNISISTTNGTVTANVVSVTADEATFSLTANLSAASFQNVNAPITFRFYGYNGESSTNDGRRMGVNSFTFNGSVVAVANTVGAPSSSPTLCINTALTDITHTTTRATGIGTATGLPAGVTAAWASNTITISGTPTASGTFNYSIPLTGGCGTVNATGTITVTAAGTAGAASSSPTLCLNTALTNITHTTTGATGIGTATGLPAGVSAVWASNAITISGTPTASGTFNYSIPLTGGCASVNATGTITVNSFFTTTSQTFDASETYTVPAGVTQLTVQAWGGGGAGGGTSNAGLFVANGGGGGGGGAYASKVINVTPGQTLNIVVGAGGSGTSANNGGNGGNSTITQFNTEILAEGGKGGTRNSGIGGIAGQAANSIGTTKTSGSNGGNGSNGYGISSGAGGASASPNGGDGGASINSANNSNNGNQGTAPGGGGGGSRTSQNGGDRTGGTGGAGRIILTAILATPNVTITANQSICVGSSATITASGATSYLWNNSLGTSSSVTVSPSSTTTYTVTGTAANGCISAPTSTIVYVKQPGSWIGAVSTDWNIAGNWCGTIPTASTDITIPNEPSNKPIIGSANAAVRSLIIESGAQLTINSSRNLEVWGNWTNNGSFTATSGSVNFKKADGVQAIGGANVSTFNNISIEGGGEKAISKDVEINGAVTFTNGYITSGNSSKLIFRTGSSVASGAGAAKDASFAKVQVVKFGTTEFEFPVGGLVNSVNKYRPIRISNLQNTSATDFFTAEHVASNPLNSLQYNTVLGSTRIYKTETPISETLTSISNFEYWNLSRSNASSVVNVTMDWSVYPTSNANAQFLRMGHYDATPSNRFWENAPNAGARSFDVATKKLTVTNVNSFSPFAIASIQAAALPVTLTSFTAKPTPDNKVSLAWVTSTEQVNKGFRIERQVGNENGKFEQIGFVASKAKDGNSQNMLTYNFIDAAPKVGAASFYRLVQEDLDGKLTYTEVRVVKLNGQSVSMVFPNPSNGPVNISRTADGKKMNIQVIDQSGRIVSQVNNVTDANYRMNISHSGVYTIKMTYPETGEQSIQRIVVQK